MIQYAINSRHYGVSIKIVAMISPSDLVNENCFLCQSLLGQFVGDGRPLRAPAAHHDLGLGGEGGHRQRDGGGATQRSTARRGQHLGPRREGGRAGGRAAGHTTPEVKCSASLVRRQCREKLSRQWLFCYGLYCCAHSSARKGSKRDSGTNEKNLGAWIPKTGSRNESIDRFGTKYVICASQT